MQPCVDSPRGYADSAQAREWDKPDLVEAQDEWAPLSTQEIARNVIQERRRQKQVRLKINKILEALKP